MAIPFEAFLPYAIMISMFGVSSVGLVVVKRIKNEGKHPRYNLDVWDRQMMDRDKRLTGSFRGQTDNPVAPPEFAVNSEWKLSKRQM
ncbi:hypothetical protein B9Z19DRAFT_1085987 [Tuber borchii]|uniref:NADH dehydrogenase [ubiquinone] 1 alpha subcomplex subunit 1 n=1 Tax=Tuber borchii TaxID=42251 RepID=A0A2T6ZQ50_TUBBO|nr:hypothetical protein B9Z19DRAFT_1085987 [Tuber borchii]